MVDSESAAEHRLQALANLNGKGYFGQKVKNLPVVLQRMPYKVHVNLGLAA